MGGRLAVCASLVLLLLPQSHANAAAIEWIDFSSWVGDSTSGSVPYVGGPIDIQLTTPAGASFSTIGGVGGGFDTASPTYSNLDTAAFRNLGIIPDPAFTGSTWSIAFDFSGSGLDSAAAFSIGQLFVSSANGLLTSIQIEAFEVDDITTYDLNNLLFEQHGRGAGFQNDLMWDPSTGMLTAGAVTASENSKYGFFKPSLGEIGRLLVTASTRPAVNSDRIDFGFVVPEGTPVIPLPAALWLFGSALGLLGWLRRRCI